MWQNKTKITFLGALAITVLINFPRIVLIVRIKEVAAQYGLTLGDVILRSIVMFCFAWMVLSFNMIWKHRWKSRPIRSQRMTDIATNTIILILFTTILTILKQQFFPGYLERRQLFFATLFTFLFVQLILLLIARVVNLNVQYQQNLLEKEQARQKALQHQLQALRAQINPHFLFNALNSLNALIRQKSEQASVFVDKLSWLLRSTLQRSDQDFITIEEEIEYLEAYVFLQKERFGDKFQVSIDVSEDWKKEMIPSFALQLLVENAIKHNVISKRQPLLVEIYQEDHFLVVKNQIQVREDTVEGTGIGLSNLSTRFKLSKKGDIQVLRNEQYFVVKLPIIHHESSHH